MFKTICEIVLDKKVSIEVDDPSIQIMPRYYSYTDSYTELDDALKENNDEKWRN